MEQNIRTKIHVCVSFALSLMQKSKRTEVSRKNEKAKKRGLEREKNRSQDEGLRCRSLAMKAKRIPHPSTQEQVFTYFLLPQAQKAGAKNRFKTREKRGKSRAASLSFMTCFLKTLWCIKHGRRGK